jgi:superfamily II DNA or RNA helicase
MSTVKLIEKFCSTLNTKYLARIPKEYQEYFKYSSVKALDKNNTNKKVALKVLQYFNLNDDGTRKFDKIGTREKGEGELKRMSIGCTGARKDDILLGTHKGTNGALIQVYNDVPPSEKILNRIRPYPDLWSKFLIKLGGIPFFSDMSIDARQMWMDINENNNDFFSEDDKLQLLQPGVGDVNKKTGSIFVAYLPSDELSRIMSVNPDTEDGYWSPTELDKIVIEYTGKTSTLVVLKTFWKISTSYKVVDNFNGPLLNIKKGVVEKGGDSRKRNDEIIIVSNIVKNVKKVGRGKTIRWEKTKEQDIGFLVSKNRFNLKDAGKVAESILNDVDMEEFVLATKGYTAAAYKSLLQKIIRYMPKYIDTGKGTIKSAESVLLACLATLIAHPGAFVPNIQRFVSGLESATKRLAVTIYEDSSMPLDQVDKLFKLLAGAFLAQRVKEWRPSNKMVKEWLKTALIGYSQRTAYVVDYKGEILNEPYIVKTDQDILKTSSAILDELRSFPGDLGLARGWARDAPNLNKSVANHQPEVMSLNHCIDQHWAPSVVYFFCTEVVLEEGSKSDWHKKSLTAKSNTPFGPLFINIFSKVTGTNPRFPRWDKWYTPDFENRPFVQETRKAQELFRVALQDVQKVRQSKGTTTLNYELSSSWLAGLVGVMTIKVKGAVTIVTMKADDPLELIVAREPRARRGKTSYNPLTPEQEEEAIDIAKSRLRKGVNMNQATVPDVSLVNCKAYLVDYDEPFYEIRKAGMKKDWEEIRFVTVTLDIHRKKNWDMKTALTRIGTGVEKDWDNTLSELFNSTDKKILRRVLIYISTANANIEMHHISRDGGGTGKSVNLYDVPAYQLLLRISMIAPGALRPVEGKPAVFSVPNGPLLWTIREMMLKKTEANISNKDVKGWKESRFTDERKMFDYQEETVSDMIKNNNEGLKGQFLWLPVGTGKTKIVLTYLAHLNEKKQLPKYIIYTLPPESVMSIIEEISMFGVKVNVMIPLKNITEKRKQFDKMKVSVTKGCEPKLYHINLIIHDHLRHCPQDLPKYAGDSIIIFDEVHLFLNQSLRTGMGMNLSHLARSFISFTGTPVIDNKTEKLISWLEQIVPFEVNKRNFWVAANNMIAKKITTGIKTEHEDVVASFTEKEQHDYQKYVPPAMGGINTNPNARDWMNAADVCYKACDRKIIELTKKLIKKERGVMIVAKDKKHQDKLRDMVIENTKLTSNDIFLITGDKSIFFTDESVKKKKTPDYKVVIVTKRKAQGYTLTRLSVMLTSVYPSNNATIEQLKGRINRLGQKTEPLLYKTVHIGILTSIMENHEKARSLSAALQAMAENN